MGSREGGVAVKYRQTLMGMVPGNAWCESDVG